MVLIMLLKYPLHKLVATMVELGAAARGYVERWTEVVRSQLQ